jgi:predicted GIY-YIG superfamily endonuclease
MKFFYVYILQNESGTKHFYTGFTEDLQDRLKMHNAGHVPHTIKFRPWRIKLPLPSPNANVPLSLNAT